MAFRLLLALDGSEQSMRAVEHVQKVLSEDCRCEITLFHVCGIPTGLLEHPGLMYPDRIEKTERRLRDQRKLWKKDAENEIENRIFEPAKRLLLGSKDIREAPRVLCKVEFEPHARVASSILWEVGRGEYDAVVLGRRGRSNLKEFLLGGVTSKVIHHLESGTIWVVE